MASVYSEGLKLPEEFTYWRWGFDSLFQRTGSAPVGPHNSLFVQHVGEQHIEHVQSTVDNKFSINSLLAVLPEGSSERDRMRVQLASSFPSGKCNCWGIVKPMKERLFDKMKTGDLLLIAPRYSANDLDGTGIEYLGVIEALGPNTGSTELSQLLWNDSAYPYAIFFSAIKGFRSWRAFFHDVGYKETKPYRGEMHRVSPSKVPNGLTSYFNFLTSATGGFQTTTPAAKLDELEDVRAEKEKEGAFDPSNLEDARKQVLAAIVVRQGRKEFREKLLAAYECRCAVTGCDVVEALEAAHIVPYLGPATDHVGNGLLLRGDIHTLFDLSLIALGPADYRVLVSKSLKGSCYEPFAGQLILLPVDEANYPNRQALEKRLAEFTTDEDRHGI